MLVLRFALMLKHVTALAKPVCPVLRGLTTNVRCVLAQKTLSTLTKTAKLSCLHTQCHISAPYYCGGPLSKKRKFALFTKFLQLFTSQMPKKVTAKSSSSTGGCLKLECWLWRGVWWVNGLVSKKKKNTSKIMRLWFCHFDSSTVAHKPVPCRSHTRSLPLFSRSSHDPWLSTLGLTADAAAPLLLQTLRADATATTRKHCRSVHPWMLYAVITVTHPSSCD